MLKSRHAALLVAGVACLFVFAFVMAPDLASAPSDTLSSLFDPSTWITASPALIALQEKRGTLVASMREILSAAEKEDRDLSEEEAAEFDKLKAEKAGLDTRITRMEEQEAAELALNTVRPGVGRNQGVQQRAQGPEANREFENLAEFLHAVRFRPNDQRLNYVEDAAADDGDELRAELRMDNDTQGGFMVPPQLRQTIMQVEPQAALVRPRANVIPAGTPPDAAITIPALNQSGDNPSNMFGGVEVKWIGEGEEKPETDVTLGNITLAPHEVAGLVTLTDKLLRNWTAAGTFVENLLRGAVTSAEDFAFQRGTGVHQPLGVINAGATYWVNRAVSNQVSYLDLVSMVARVLMRGGSPVWSMPQAALPQIATLQDPEGRYIWKPDARDGFAGTLLGYPLRWNNRSPLLGTKGDLILADWSHYLIKDGSGPFVAASEHVKFTSNKTVIKIFWNVDGAPWLTAPIKEENGYELSPFVGLDVPAG